MLKVKNISTVFYLKQRRREYWWYDNGVDGCKSSATVRAYTKESLFPNSSEWCLAEHPKDVPDLLPTQGKSDTNVETLDKNVSDRKATNSASDKMIIEDNH